MKAVYIKVHSFVDLITNSSSEVFISANSEVIATLYSIANKLLLLKDPNATLKAEDVLNIEEVYPKGSYFNEDDLDKDALANIPNLSDLWDGDELKKDVPVNSPFGKLICDYDENQYEYWNRIGTKVAISVKENHPDSEKFVEVLKEIDSLFGKHTMEGYQNG